jgi:hypothetical protein
MMRHLTSHLRPRFSHKAFTVFEMLIAVSAASILMALVMGLYIFGLRSFNAIGNYTSMDANSRRALDLMLRELRQSSLVLGSQATGTNQWLKVATTIPSAATNTFTWNTTTGDFTWDKTGQSMHKLLTGCTNWSFAFYKRSPNSSGDFLTTTVSKQTKLINMSWTCTRTNVFRINTENVITAEVVLRNLQE